MTAADRFRSVLANRQYRYFLASSNSAGVGYSVYAISVVWLAYALSHDFLIVGAVLFIEFASYTLTFLVGPVVDRVRNQRSVFLICYPVQAVAALTLGLGFLRGFLSVPLLLLLVALISLLWDFAWASGNVTPGLLLSPDEQFAASGVSGALGGVNAIMGYAAGGALILVVGPGGGLLLYAVLLALGAALALPLRVASPRREVEGFRASFRTGWAAAAAGPGAPLLQLAGVDALAGFLTAVPPLLVTLSTTAYFHSSPFSYSLLFTSYVVGGVASSAFLGGWNPRHRVGHVVAAALGGAGGAFVLVTVAPPDLYLLAAAWFSVGFALTAYTNAKYVFYRGAVPPDKLGRVISNLYLFPGISSSVGALTVGALAGGLTPIDVGLVAATGFLLSGALAVALPGVRRLKY